MNKTTVQLCIFVIIVTVLGFVLGQRNDKPRATLDKVLQKKKILLNVLKKTDVPSVKKLDRMSGNRSQPGATFFSAFDDDEDDDLSSSSSEYYSYFSRSMPEEEGRNDKFFRHPLFNWIFKVKEGKNGAVFNHPWLNNLFRGLTIRDGPYTLPFLLKYAFLRLLGFDPSVLIPSKYPNESTERPNVRPTPRPVVPPTDQTDLPIIWPFLQFKQFF